ncbi:MAG TPA: hypothetical protein VMH88_04735 [Gemmatimonadales bacterium]|nr:hypothetical protein [Gemmatimonadales bacterium]
MIWPWRLWVIFGLVTLAACGADRERPAPPQLSVKFDKDSVSTSDTLQVTMAANDPDGIDSVFLVVDSEPTIGADAYLQTSFVGSVLVQVRPSHVRGQRVTVQFSARDTHGWVGILDTFVVAKGL